MVAPEQFVVPWQIGSPERRGERRNKRVLAVRARAVEGPAFRGEGRTDDTSSRGACFELLTSTGALGPSRRLELVFDDVDAPDMPPIEVGATVCRVEQPPSSSPGEPCRVAVQFEAPVAAFGTEG